MKHKWKKSDFKKLIITDNDNIYTCVKIYECINCGLRKGTKQSAGASVLPPYHRYLLLWLIYFKDSKILSFNRIPYECSGINFLKKDDFYIT